MSNKDEANRLSALPASERPHGILVALNTERERCAQIAEAWLAIFGHVKPEFVDARQWATDGIRDIIDEIRNPKL